MRKLLSLAALVGMALAGSAQGLTILYNQSGVLSGYKAQNSTAFTQSFEAAFGGTPELAADFSNASQVMSADVIFVNIRGAVSSLSATEQANLVAFANTGKPMFMLGDNYLNFNTWNASILTPFGGVNYAFSANTLGVVVKVNDHPLTAGLDVLPDTVNPGTIQTGGYPLWASTYAFNPYAVGALFGPSNNVLILLELGPLNNTTLASNMGAWAQTVTTSIPEPAVATLILSGMLMGIGRVGRGR